MPVAVEIPQETFALPHKLWTRDECETLGRAGLVDLNRYELIEGELIQKMPKNIPHVMAVALLSSWLRKIYGELWVVTEPTIDLRPEDSPASAPEPDVIVLTRSIREYQDWLRPDEVRLVAEVSSTTLPFDMTIKARLYARSGIVEYWVLDLEGRRLIVHRDPVDDTYSSIQAYVEQEFVSTLATPDHEIRVRELLQ